MKHGGGLASAPPPVSRTFPPHWSAYPAGSRRNTAILLLLTQSVSAAAPTTPAHGGRFVRRWFGLRVWGRLR